MFLQYTSVKEIYKHFIMTKLFKGNFKSCSCDLIFEYKTVHEILELSFKPYLSNLAVTKTLSKLEALNCNSNFLLVEFMKFSASQVLDFLKVFKNFDEISFKIRKNQLLKKDSNNLIIFYYSNNLTFFRLFNKGLEETCTSFNFICSSNGSLIS